jgi:serine/threonine protein kinase
MDKYQVHEMIGEGSYGRVFKATCRATGNPVALKLIPKVRYSASLLFEVYTRPKLVRYRTYSMASGDTGTFYFFWPTL